VSLDDDGMGREVNTQRKGSGTNQHLNCAFRKQVFNGSPIFPYHPSMMDAKSKRQEILEIVILDVLGFVL
jgi:hypothetical protein